MSRHGNPKSTDIDAIESRDAGLGVSLFRIGQILARPDLKRWRPAMGVALLFTIVSKLFAVAAPVYFGDAVNKLSAGEQA
ncbi:MAG TPA: metal ABC transporter permease, partial [Hyphomonadaceae bacterium]|nr:metal ABC transporter permease [Hyphomonadaceae bacterium]